MTQPTALRVPSGLKCGPRVSCPPGRPRTGLVGRFGPGQAGAASANHVGQDGNPTRLTPVCAGVGCGQRLTAHVLPKGHGLFVPTLMTGCRRYRHRCGLMVRPAPPMVPTAWAACQGPKGMRARQRLPVIFDVRVTKPGRPPVASISSDAQKSVAMDTALRVQAGREVSLAWCGAMRQAPHLNPARRLLFCLAVEAVTFLASCGCAGGGPHPG